MSKRDFDSAFFGCWGAAGHFLWDKSKNCISRSMCEQYMLPQDHHLDGNSLLLPYPEVKGHGACTYLPAMNLTILSWWNSVWDARSAVNSSYMLRGDYQLNPRIMWHAFEHNFPDVWKMHTKPIIQARY